MKYFTVSFTAHFHQCSNVKVTQVTVFTYWCWYGFACVYNAGALSAKRPWLHALCSDPFSHLLFSACIHVCTSPPTPCPSVTLSKPVFLLLHYRSWCLRSWTQMVRLSSPAALTMARLSMSSEGRRGGRWERCWEGRENSVTIITSVKWTLQQSSRQVFHLVTDVFSM